MLTAEPPELGAAVEIEAFDVEHRSVSTTRSTGELTIVRSGEMALLPTPPERVVPRAWVERADAVMRRPLKPYQAHGAGWLGCQLAAGRGAILGDAPGSGKTAQAIAALLAAQLFPAIVVCPASVAYNWRDELGWARWPLSSTVVEHRRGPLESAHVYIVPYDLIRFREAHLLALRPAAIIYDEGQFLKEPRPRQHHRAAVATRLARAIQRVAVLTGTPLLNRPQDLWRLLHIVDPIEWPHYEDFRARYCRPPTPEEAAARPDLEEQRLVTSHGRLERRLELKARVQAVMLRRLKSEVAKDLPPKRVETTRVRLDPAGAGWQAYSAAETNLVAWLREQRAPGARVTNAMRHTTLVKLTILRHIAAVAKARELAGAWLEAWFRTRPNDPLVVFAYHLDVLAEVQNHCRRLGARTVSISGGDAPSKRQVAIDVFQSGGADVFIAPIRAGGVGINLHRAATALMLERTWVPMELEQCHDRIHRLGQNRPVTIYYVDAAGTIDEYIAKVLDAKRRLIDAIVENHHGTEDAAEQTAAQTAGEMVAALLTDGRMRT